MAGFDRHKKCACCRDKGIAKNVCVVGDSICEICRDFTDSQQAMLAIRVSVIKGLAY